MPKKSEEGGSDSEEDEQSGSGEASNAESENSANNSDNEEENSDDSKDGSKSESGSSDSESQSGSENSSDENEEEEQRSEKEAESGSDYENDSDSNRASGSEEEEENREEEGDNDGDADEDDDDDDDDNDNDEDDEDEDDDDDRGNSSLNTSRASSQSKSSSSSSRSDKNNLKQNPDIYGIRRSNRERKQPDRITIERKEKTSKTHKRRSSSQWNSSEESQSEESDSEAETYTKKRPKVHKKPTKKASQRKSDSDDSETTKRKRSSRGVTRCYKEETEDEEDEEDLVEVDWGTQTKEEEENVQTIEKIISHRQGKKGAVGMQTYIYEVEKNGDPNSDFDSNDPEQREMQYLIKWKGWAHIHNTWESEESLKTQKVKGYKKLENYLRKEEDVQLWRNRASPEEIEYMEIQAELERDLFASHIYADRVFAEVVENGNTYYYIKWQNLPYAEATWELEELVKNRYPTELKAYKDREQSSCFPKQCPVLKHRPKFSPLKVQPDFVGGSNQNLELRDYQMDGLNWLIHSWCKHNSVILADEMGLGKTIQTIAFLSYLFHTHHLYGPFLLVLPLSTLNAWQKEFSQWAPQMNVIVYIGDRDSRRIIHDYEWTFRSTRIKFNAVLTTYEILLRDKEVLQDSCQWAVLVIDEAHRLKNEESQLYQALREFKTNHRLLITGTPLQNSLKELWALLHFIMPNKFDNWEYFESQHDGDNMKKGFHRLHRQLEPYLLRRVKKDVEKSLPAKVEQILRVDMTQLQKQYYKWILTKNYDMLKKGTRGSTSSFVNIVMELKKCCNHAFLTKHNDEPSSGPADMVQQLLRGSGKLMLLDKLLVRLNETGHRVLIFSQMVRMLDILAQYLQLRRFPFQRLDGSISGDLRRQALDHFNAEGSSDFCFLLSTRAGGLGINLATADTVIIFDSDWNPQNDLQAQARAHRIGQKNQVNIYRLVTKSSIEETIIERAKQKMVLDHLVIQSMDTSGRTVFNKKISSTTSTPFNKEELNAILKFGAEELFKDDEMNEEEPMCDIDEILRRAETRDEGPASAGEELLSAFKVASFNLDEEEEVSKMDSLPDENTMDWDEIIPENIRSQVADEERKKEMADLYLPPRKRKTLNQDEKETTASPVKKIKKESESSGGDEDSDEDKPKRRGRPRMYHKETVKGFTDAEVRRFFKSFKKFSNPLRRLDTIANDADMREKTTEELRFLGNLIINRCKEALKEHENHKSNEKLPDANGGATATKKRRDRAPSFKLSGVSINAKTTLAIIDELEPLDRVVPHAPVERASWNLPLKKVKDAHWDVPWGMQEDSRLLRGIYEYGMGSWEQLKGDPALNLGDKILLEANLKPQSKHLESRAQYLLKLIRKTQAFVTIKQTSAKPKLKKFKEPKGISKEIIENDDSTDDEATNMSAQSAVSKKSVLKETVKEEKKHPKEAKPETKEEEKEVEKKHKHDEQRDKSKKKKKEKREKSQGPVHITANGEPIPVDNTTELDQNHPQWPECKEKMRPMKKALKALDNPNKSVSQEEQIQHTRKCLIQIGDHIEKTLQQYQDHDTHKEWKNLLWQFVSKFTEYDAKKLHKLYKKHKKLVDEKKDENGKVEKKEHKKDKEKHRDDKKKDKGEDDKHHSHKRRNEDDQSQQNKKKPYNGWSTDRNRDNMKRSEKGRERDDRDRDRSRDRDRDRERSGDRSYQRSWHGAPMNREYSKESRYPQDFKREGGYHREGGFKSHGYHRGQSDWGGRPHHQKHPGGYGPAGGYPHPGHYPQPQNMYGMIPGGGRMPHHPTNPYGGPHWGGKSRNERHDWGKDPANERGGGPNPDWVKKDPRQEQRPDRQF